MACFVHYSAALQFPFVAKQKVWQKAPCSMYAVHLNLRNVKLMRLSIVRMNLPVSDVQVQSLSLGANR